MWQDLAFASEEGNLMHMEQKGQAFGFGILDVGSLGIVQGPNIRRQEVHQLTCASRGNGLYYRESLRVARVLYFAQGLLMSRMFDRVGSPARTLNGWRA